MYNDLGNAKVSGRFAIAVIMFIMVLIWNFYCVHVRIRDIHEEIDRVESKFENERSKNAELRFRIKGTNQ